MEMNNEEKTFEFYKNYLKELDNKRLRYIVIRYVCSFPKIDPVEMAISLIHEGYHIEFDDSSISQKENTALRNKVYRAAKLDRDNDQ